MRINITCICDNNVKLSTHLRGEHGISFYIENGKDKVLFDTGQSFAVMSHNSQELGIDLGGVEKIVLSHGHYDHTGGLDRMLDYNIEKVFCHPCCFEEKYKMVDSEPVYIGIPVSRESIEKRTELILSKSRKKICDNILMTGEIQRWSPHEGVPDVFFKKEDGKLIKDNILDDQSLIVDNGKEAILLLGCNHSGLINTFKGAMEMTSSKITTIAGGTHLVAAGKGRMDATISFLKEYDVMLYGFHCTGDEASVKLRKGLGDSYYRGFTGMSFEL